MKSKTHITVFEHQTLKLNQDIDQNTLIALQNFHGEKGVPYYTLINKGIKFCEYVGVIQVGNIFIEILPKADKKPSTKEDEYLWRNMLLGMLKTISIFNIHAPSSTSLKLKSNNILDLYFELFLDEVEYLMQRGLTKVYRKIESNCSSLKGSIQFSKNISKNLVHQERFYVRHTTYDMKHKFHQILYKTVLLLKRINTNMNLHSRIGALLLNFPEQKDITVSDSTFERIIYNRKTEPYKQAMEIARLLLLNYHPDIAKGKNYVLALMFDMNLLWEQFIYTSLRKGLQKTNPEITVTAQTSKSFWQPEKGRKSLIRPDILIRNRDNGKSIVLDTKWKNLNGYSPSPDDLKQMFVYHEYYNASKVALVYPGDFEIIKGNYISKNDDNMRISDQECSLLGITINGNISELKSGIVQKFIEWNK